MPKYWFNNTNLNLSANPVQTYESNSSKVQNSNFVWQADQSFAP